MMAHGAVIGGIEFLNAGAAADYQGIGNFAEIVSLTKRFQLHRSAADQND